MVGSAFWTWYSTSAAAGYGQPIADQVCPAVDFCSQEFQNGTAYWKPRFGPHGVLKSSPVGLKYFADGGYATYGMPDRDNTHFYGGSSIGIPESDQQGFENAIIVVPNGAAAFTLYRPKEIVMLLDPLGGSPAPQWVSPITCGLPPKGGCAAQTLAVSSDPSALVVRRNYEYPAMNLSYIDLPGQVWKHWNALGAENSWLGVPQGVGCSGLLPAGYCETSFQNGVILANASSAVTMKGAILQWWNTSNGPNNLGIPLGDERCGLAQSGCRQDFAGSSLTWTAGLGVQTVKGAIRDKWLYMGAEASRLGYPTGPETCFGWIVNNVDKSGCYQWFQGGIIWWSAASGTHVVRGAIMSAYERAGWVWPDYNSSGYPMQMIGYPISDENCTGPGGGCYQWFENGIIWWSPTTGAQRLMNGDKRVFESLNWAWGPLGYPTTEERWWNDYTAYPKYYSGTRQYFEHGYLTWTDGYGITVTYY